MTPLQITTWTLFAITAVVAVVLAKKDKRHRPVAWYLVAIVSVEVGRFLLMQLLPATAPPQPYKGWILIVRNADMAAYLGMIMALPAMTMALFLRKRPWIVGVVYVAILAVLIAGYPSIRGNDLLRFYSAIELAGVIVSIGFFIMWLGSPRQAEEGASVPIMSGMALTTASLSTVVLPSLTGPEILAQWSVLVALHAVCFAVVLVFQLRYLLAGKAKL